MSNVIPMLQSSQSVFVLQIRASPKLGKVKAYADVQYHGATLKGFSIAESPKGGHFIGFPSNLSNGKRYPIVEFAEPERSHIARLVLEAAKELLK